MVQVYRFLQPTDKLSKQIYWWVVQCTSSSQVSLAKYPPETASILHINIFWFFLKDEEFISKTINDSNIDLEKFPASKVRQFALEMQSSKSTTRHIKAVASDSQAAEVNLMRHQRTDLPPSKSNWKQHSHKHRSKSQKRYSNEQAKHKKEEIDVQSVVTLNM